MPLATRHDESSDHLIRVTVDGLKLGMFVAELDRPWIETPFLLEGLLLGDSDDLLTLQRYCQLVFVDPERSSAHVQDILKALVSRQEASSASSFSADHTVTSNRHLQALSQGLKQVRRDYDEARVLIRRLIDDQQSWHRNLPQIKETVSSFASSILSNSNALNWLSRIKHENEYTAEHCLNVAVLAMLFGRHLGLERPQIEELGLAGMLHDVGKMKLDQDILNKPGKLTAEEFDHIKTHTLEGYDMLSEDPNLPDVVKEASRDHHERLDGSGYPHGKGNEEISQTAKIIAIVDTYDAITSDRIYSKARPSSEALKIIYETRGKLYDDHLAIKFIECIGVYPPGSIVELSNGMVGVVISAESKQRLQPRILAVLDEQKAAMTHTVIDLAELSNATNSAPTILRILPPGTYGIQLGVLLEHIA